MPPLKNHSLIFACLAAALILIGGAAYWAIVPLSGKIKNTAARIQNGKSLEYASKKRIEAMPRALNEIAVKSQSIKKDEAVLRSLFINQNNVLSFILQMEKNASNLNLRAKLNFIQSAAQSGKSASANQSLRFDVSTAGSSSALLQYLRLTESLPYYLNLKKISFRRQPRPKTPDSAANLPPRFQLNFTLEIAAQKAIKQIEADSLKNPSL